MIKTLIVDDSPLVRSILKSFLESDGAFQVIAEAGNGQEGVDLAKTHSPDLITMDFEMPVMNGLDAIAEIRKFSECGIVVISTHDTAKMAYEAAVKGAHDFFAKDNFLSQMNDRQKNNILDTLKQIAKLKRKFHLLPETPEQNFTSSKKIDCVVIASSTGGPIALCQLFSSLPENFPVPILVVQHNTSGFDKGFVQWLDGYSQLKIQLAEEGIIPSKGNVYVGPTEKHLVAGISGLSFDYGDHVCNQKPAADVLFISAAEQYGSSLVSVVLTGMGKDGAEGTRYVKNAGGVTIAQNEETSMIFGMPKEAIETGCVDMILPLNEIAQKLIALTGENN